MLNINNTTLMEAIKVSKESKSEASLIEQLIYLDGMFPDVEDAVVVLSPDFPISEKSLRWYAHRKSNSMPLLNGGLVLHDDVWSVHT